MYWSILHFEKYGMSILINTRIRSFNILNNNKIVKFDAKIILELILLEVNLLGSMSIKLNPEVLTLQKKLKIILTKWPGTS